MKIIYQPGMNLFKQRWKESSGLDPLAQRYQVRKVPIVVMLV